MPYTTANLMFEPSNSELLGVLTRPGTFLDFVAKVSPSYLKLIQIAKMEAFYNDPNRSYTFFLSDLSDLSDEVLNCSPDFARRLLTTSTLKGYITTNMLTNGLVLDPINPYEKLFVSTFSPQGTKSPCEQSMCSLVCSQPSMSNIKNCNNSRVNCVLKQPTRSETPTGDTCAELGKRLIQINNRTLTQGDVFVNSGIIHIIDKPLFPLN